MTLKQLALLNAVLLIPTASAFAGLPGAHSAKARSARSARHAATLSKDVKKPADLAMQLPIASKELVEEWVLNALLAKVSVSVVWFRPFVALMNHSPILWGPWIHLQHVADALLC